LVVEQVEVEHVGEGLGFRALELAAYLGKAAGEAVTTDLTGAPASE